MAHDQASIGEIKAKRDGGGASFIR